jgi:signal transduction histidine kinase/CheY-like chemotaxis protein
MARERYLAAVVSVQQKLLVSHDPQKVYDEVLAILGRASGASRVYIFENRHDTDGCLLMSRKAEWCAEGVKPEIDNPLLQNLLYDEAAPNWLEILSQGKIINGIVRDFPQPERELLESQSIRSVLALPLIVNEEFFGFICFDNRVEERVWDEAQVELLQAAAQTISLTHERMQAEKALRESEEKLRQAQKFEAIGRLAGGIAHDFNNILTSVIGYSDISLRRLSKDDPLRHNLEEIRKAADRAANLTHQLLAYSRRQILQPSLLNLNEIVFEMDKMLQRLIGEDMTLEVTLAKGLGKIKADKGQIEQVLMNLVVNARDAMPKGGKLFIETANIELHEPVRFKAFSILPDKYVLLQVSDTGHGMNDEVKAQIFEPFFTTKEMGKGTGLGLATVYGIVKQSGGYIIVESEVEKGTKFNVYLPLSDEEEKKMKDELFNPETKHGIETILLVEDDEVVRKMTKEVLETVGYKVFAPTDCDEAIDVCQKYNGAIHLLLTDVVMPKLSGRELAKQLLLMRPELKVLYMSGYTDDKTGHHSVFDEGVKLIQKPYTIDILTHEVREALDLFDRN